MTQSQQILIVSDDVPDASLRGTLEQRGFEVTIAKDAETAYHHLLESAFDLLIIDLVQASEGLGLLKLVRSTSMLSKTFVLTIADWGTGQPTLALSQGADAFEPKPIDPARLIAAVERLLRQPLVKSAGGHKWE